MDLSKAVSEFPLIERDRELLRRAFRFERLTIRALPCEVCYGRRWKITLVSFFWMTSQRRVRSSIVFVSALCNAYFGTVRETFRYAH